jgi:Ankyrin repeat
MQQELIHKMVVAIECHNYDEAKYCFDQNLDSNSNYDGRPLVYTLIEMYSRGPVFKKLFKLFVDNGLQFDDEILKAIFLDDATLLTSLLEKQPDAIFKTYSLNCTFTPLYEASLLHICAEYNHFECAKILLKKGLDVNVKVGKDADGFGGHTAIFHTVNQHNNFNMDMLNLLLEAKADTQITITGLIWGKGFEWETYIPAVNPISYAMMGLLRQFQRTESDVYAVVEKLQKASFGISYSPQNIPNKYLNS